MKKFLSVILSFLLSLFVCISASAESGNVLTFGDDGKFVILQISDPQDDQNPSADMIELIKLSIEKTDPDLIVFTGDIVEDAMENEIVADGEIGEGVVIEGDYEQTLKNVKSVCDAVFSLAENKDIPFAVAMGNNDYKCGVTAEDWLKIFAGYENCLVKDESPDSGSRIDYNLEIKSDDGKTAFNIWVADSGQDEITPEQIEWYKKESDALKSANGGEAVPSIWFQHIQTADIGNLFEKCDSYNIGAMQMFNKYYRLNPHIASGYFTEIRMPGHTSDVFKAWKSQGDVSGAYFGHMHTEGYTGTYDGIELGYTYGCQFAKEGPYGMRVFKICEDDVKDYDSDLYTYEGSVKKGNARLRLSEGYSNPTIESVRTVFEYIIKTVTVFTVVKVILNFICK